jgi:hypothetical protein
MSNPVENRRPFDKIQVGVFYFSTMEVKWKNERYYSRRFN